jgi:hypothetical protein
MRANRCSATEKTMNTSSRRIREASGRITAAKLWQAPFLKIF